MASDISPEARGRADKSLDDARAAHSEAIRAVATAQERLDAVQAQLARLNKTSIAAEATRRATVASVLSAFTADDREENLLSAAEFWHAASLVPTFLAQELLYLGSTVLPDAEDRFFESQVALLFSHADSLKAQAIVQTQKRNLAAVPLLEIEGGSLEMPPNGATVEIIKRAVEAYSTAAQAQQSLDESRARRAAALKTIQ